MGKKQFSPWLILLDGGDADLLGLAQRLLLVGSHSPACFGEPPHTTPTSDPPPPPNPFSEPRGAKRAPQTRRNRQGEGPAAEETPGPRKAAGTKLRVPRSPAEPLGPRALLWGRAPRRPLLGAAGKQRQWRRGGRWGEGRAAAQGRSAWGVRLKPYPACGRYNKGAWIRQGNTGCLYFLGQCGRWCAKCWC